MSVFGLFIIVAFIAATTERREFPPVAGAAANPNAPENASTVAPGARDHENPDASGGLRVGEHSSTPAFLASAQGISVDEAAARISASAGRPSIVILYGTGCPLSKRMFGDFAAMARRHPGVQVLAFETDEENGEYVPNFLSEHGATFPAVYIRRWPDGDLTRAMAPFGIEVGSTWTRPLVAVRDAEGRVIAQGQGVTDLAGIEQALGQLR